MIARRRTLTLAGLAALAAWILWPAGTSSADARVRAPDQPNPSETQHMQDSESHDPAPDEGLATFAGGCFWCVEEAFEAVPGVGDVVSGYTGGSVPNPSYEQVSAGGTGHAEAVRVTYDPARVSYEQLLDIFWRNIDPTVPNRQFCDVGPQYRSAIFYHDDAQRAAAERTKAEVQQRLGTTIHTQIVPAGEFFVAEDYHQDYYRKNPVRYKFYKWNCGRQQRLEQLWGR